MPVLSKLFSPVKIGNVELRNRLVMSPMTTQWAGPDDTVTPRLLAYHEARARGGVGLITFEVSFVDRLHPYQPRSVGLYDDKLIPSHRELTKVVHAHGAKVVPQISHPGPESVGPFRYKVQALGPSVVRCEMTNQVCRELTLEEIEIAIEQYGEAARRAREAGYDGMELHCAHSYMLAGSFLSPRRNKRTDAFGGSVEGLLRFPTAVIKRMKAKAGGDFPLILRISGDERVPDGRDLQGTLAIVPKLVEAGVDAFHVSGGVIDRLTRMVIPSAGTPMGLNVEAAAAIKRVVQVPVMVVGRIKDPRIADDILQRNQADLVVMGRALLADPEMPNKAREGRFDDIRPCIYCDNCFDSMAEGDYTNLNCAVNAATGKERELGTAEPAQKAKKVMVVGGGPAGMEAARVAAMRGHKVAVYDKGHRLGGSLIFACTVHRDNEDFLDYIRGQVRKLPIEVKLGKEVTPALVKEINPDVVVVALGPKLVAPRIPGDERRNVLSGPDLKEILGGRVRGPGAKRLPSWQRAMLYLGGPVLRRGVSPSLVRRVTKWWMPLGKRVVVIGGDLAGCELAEFIAARGRKVTVLESKDKIAPEVGLKRKAALNDNLKHGNVTVLTGVKYEEITDRGVVITTKDGQKQTVEADTVVLAGEAEPNTELFQAIQGSAPEVFSAGDCAKLGLIRGAVYDADRIACKI
ncbi:MAG: FAD-dependent oxidoreductase [Chloroflexi bacterium]|nr:FAD-dependent oxidoreductase [Chloroflexota bacterium]